MKDNEGMFVPHGPKGPPTNVPISNRYVEGQPVERQYPKFIQGQFGQSDAARLQGVKDIRDRHMQRLSSPVISPENMRNLIRMNRSILHPEDAKRAEEKYQGQNRARAERLRRIQALEPTMENAKALEELYVDP